MSIEFCFTNKLQYILSATASESCKPFIENKAIIGKKWLHRFIVFMSGMKILITVCNKQTNRSMFHSVSDKQNKKSTEELICFL